MIYYEGKLVENVNHENALWISQILFWLSSSTVFLSSPFSLKSVFFLLNLFYKPEYGNAV